MNKLAKRATAIGLSAALCLGITGAAFAKAGRNQQPRATAQVEKLAAAQPAGQEAIKDETVYVLAGADGSVQKLIVSDWIQNTLSSATLTDRTELTDIKPVKGDESCTLNGDSMAVWDAKGGDIYYQGSIEKELPVNLTISYQLDGKTVSPAELAGQSGRVTIRFDYENRQYQMADVGGSQEKVYVPFAMLTGVLLDNGIFRNVEVTNGRLINDGDRTIVVGLALPGLQESLALDRDLLDIPDCVEITADVTGFSLGMTATIATNALFSDLELGQLEDAEDLTGSLHQLTEAMDQLMDGSSALYDGLCTLLDKSGELAAGVEQLAQGTQSIQTGAGSLNSGAAQLKSGLAELSGGLSALSASSAGLNGGAQQVFESLLATATTQLQTAGISVPALTIDNYTQVLDGVIASLGAAAEGESGQTFQALRASLDSYNTFYQGLRTYTGGVDTAASGAAALTAGADALASGTAQLKAGTDSLCSGALTLQGSMPALVSSVSELRDGSMALSDGLRQFNEEGVQKLTDLLGDDLEGLADRLQITIDISRSYRSFAGIADNMDGQVKFIYRTAEIK